MPLLQNLVESAERYIWPGTAARLLGQAKIINASDDYQFAVQADFAGGGSISYTITVDDVAGSSVSLDPTTVILDTPSVGDSWPYTSKGGFNFKALLDGSNFSLPDTKYQIDVTFVLSSGVTFKGRWVAKTKGNVS